MNIVNLIVGVFSLILGLITFDEHADIEVLLRLTKRLRSHVVLIITEQ